MRITTFSVYQSSINNLQTRQRELATSQEQMTSGKRVSKASDDPAAAARAERAMAAMSRSDANQRALDASRTAMQESESALGQAGDLLQTAREAIMQAGNPTYTDAERGMLVQSLRGMRDQLLAVANRTDAVGTSLFGGQGSASVPFVDSATGVQYQGSPGQTQATAGQDVPLSIDGRNAWMQAPNPVAGGAPLSTFDVMDRIINQLATPGQADSQIAQTVHDGLRDLDAVSNNLSTWRARTGDTLNRADSLESRISESKLSAQTDRSQAEDLDMVQAISNFQNQQTGYDAALKAYSSVQRLSLFNYISG